MADGKVVIETDLDASGIKKGLSKIESITSQGLKVAAATISGVSVALAGVSTAAIKVGSDFEAQMSRVKAISGATGEEFEKLKNQAIQLGADTAFSSTQAAEGMENLAAAGFATNEIIEAMPGLLDLAAASGEDLANSSDIAASTLRGFGLAASDAGHIADVLAENANRTNSSVAETGEAMKYIAPLARAAGISMEETAAAIGIMANAGIQGSQAGTTLRGALSRLSKPTDDMQLAMDQLGISFYDSEGKMKSLSEQVAMLKDAMSDMTDEQKNNYLVTLYGQESLSGMLALINEGPDSLSKLTDAYEVCDGSAQKAAETMQDNLSGAVEQLKGSAESLGIVFYENVADSMKNAAVQATDSVNNIKDAFTNGGLDDAISAAGDEFASLAVKAAEHAPDMVDTAVDFIEAFAKGIVQNRGKLIGAAGDVAESFAEGLAELLPEQVQEPVEDAIDAISESLSSGGLKDAGKTIVKTFDNVIDVVGELAKTALPPLTKTLDFAGENLDVLAASAVTAFTAFKGYKVVKNTSKAINSLSATVKLLSAAEKANALQVLAASGALTTKEMIVGVLTGKITLATAAQTAWNAVMAANPIGLLVTAVGALTAGLAALTLFSKDSQKEMYSLSEGQKEVLKSCNETTEAMRQQRETREESVQSIDREYDSYEALLTELQTITDENGKVKAGYEERANVITGLLSDALGIEIEMMDGVIQKYDETIESIKELITQKKAEATINAMQDDMAKAYEKTSEAMEKYKTASAKLEEQNKKVADAQEKLNSAQEDWEWAAKNAPDDLLAYEKALESAKDGLKKAEEGQRNLEKSVNDSKNEINSFATEINNYDALVSAMASGSTKEIEQALNALVTSYQSYTAEALASSETTRQEMFAQANGYVENMKLIQDGTLQVADSVYQDMANAAIKSINEFNKLPGGVSAGIEAIGPEASAAMISALTQADLDGKLDAEGKASMDNLINAVSNADGEVKTAVLKALKPMLDESKYSALEMKINGGDAGTGYAEGVGSKKEEAKKQGEALADNAKKGADTGKKKGKDAGSDFGAGFIDGIGAKIESAMEKAKEFGASVLGALKNALGIHSPSRKAREVGNFFGQGFALGIQDDENMVRSASEDIANTALSSLNMSDISARMREAMAVNTGRVTKSFALETNTNLLSHSEAEVLMKLSEEDIEKLAYLFGSVAGEKVADSVDGMTMEMDGRPFGRIIKEALE